MKICLLITTFNRGHLLDRSLTRIKGLTLPDEILVVDDGSTDNTEEVCKNHGVRYIYNHNPDWSICSFSRNIGVKNTDCDYIITTEPEILFVDNIIERFKTNLLKENNILSVGSIYHQEREGQFPVEVYNNPDIVKTLNCNTQEGSKENYFTKIVGWQATYTAMYKKEWIEEVGGWDEQFPAQYGVDDIDLCTRIRIKLGIGQIVDNELSCIHQWHQKPPQSVGDAVINNMNYFLNKKLSRDGIEDKNNINLVSNQGKEWGILKKR